MTGQKFQQKKKKRYSRKVKRIFIQITITDLPTFFA